MTSRVLLLQVKFCLVQHYKAQLTSKIPYHADRGSSLFDDSRKLVGCIYHVILVAFHPSWRVLSTIDV
jgi:hypothetical protein